MISGWEGRPVVLASQSPRRQELLGRLFTEFTVEISLADETLPAALPPRQAVELLAARKARTVAAGNPQALVIGADTVVALEERLLGKPRDEQDAVRMLQALSGRTHTVYTGVCLCWQGMEESFSCATQVVFKPLSREEIDWYLSTGEPFDKAGAYGIQGYGARFVREIQGDYFNVMGLPVNLLYETLARFPDNSGKKI